MTFGGDLVDDGFAALLLGRTVFWFVIFGRSSTLQRRHFHAPISAVKEH